MIPFEYPVSAVIASAFLAFALGMFWYHPKVMGTKWMEARGIKVEKMKPSIVQIALSLVLWLFSACFYAFLVGLLDIQEFPALVSLACLLWVAFTMPPVLMGAMYSGYPFQAAAIDSAYQLAGYYIFAIMFAFLT